MKARDVMTRDVATARPDMSVREVAALLLARGISAVPVVDEAGFPVGMISEGDLLGRDQHACEARRDWWLALLAEGGELNPDFLATLRRPAARVRDVMSAPVVTVNEDADLRDVARLLIEYRIKRVPVVRGRRAVGIISRADLLRAMTAAGSLPVQPRAPNGGHGFFSWVDHQFHPEHAGPASRTPAQSGTAPSEQLDVAVFRHLAADFHHLQAEHRDAARRAVAAKLRERAKELIDGHISDANWRALLHQARLAAERGETEVLLLRFPPQLLSDSGRAINAAEPGWPHTLRGEAAELYLRWKHDLKPRGFGIGARVLEFPGGMPGDVGLFLIWGE